MAWSVPNVSPSSDKPFTLAVIVASGANGWFLPNIPCVGKIR
jgi:hypothetical protein